MKTKKIPRPSPEQVLFYLNKWDNQERDVILAEALEILFTKTYPKNTDIHQVLIKASALNDFYKTNIFDIWTIARHIQNLDIDERLHSGDSSLVEDLASVVFNNNIHKRFYSFATKYCCFHRPDCYPIYDRYVEKMLLHFKRSDNFYSFRAIELRDYPKFQAIISAFQEYYGLLEFSKRELDHYLWLAGNDYYNNTPKR